MSDSEIHSALEELALLTVMLGDNDSQGMTFVADTLKKLQDQLQVHNLHQAMVQSIGYLLAIKREDDGAHFVSEVKDFVSKGQSYLSGATDVSFPIGGDITSDSSSETHWGDDLSSQADDELIVEFIEKHTSLLDDYEAQILEAESQGLEQEDREELDASIKSYLHNVKGDAGSVGLSGVERVTHAFEDQLLACGSKALTEALIAYKEWVLDVCTAYSQANSPKQLSSDFLSFVFKSTSDASSCTTSDVQAERKGTVTESDSFEQIVDSSSEEVSFTSEEYSVSGDAEILSEFMVEAEDHLGIVEELLLDSEAECSLEDLGAIFRAVHSIKGGSAYFTLKEITESSHIMESLMDKARDGKIIFNSVLRELVLDYIQIQRELLAQVREVMEESGTLTTTLKVHEFKLRVDDYLKAVQVVQGMMDGATIEELIEEAGVLTEEAVESSGQKRPEKATSQEDTTKRQTNIVEENSSQDITIEASQSASLAETKSTKPKANGARVKVKLKNFVKIETSRLDSLIEYIGEMVISSSMLIKNCREMLSEDDGVISNTHQLERISREIQDIGMSMRLIPIKGLFQKMSRVVWDTAKKLKKDVKFEMEGEDTELDRSVIDKLADPLMHMVRNAVDHGIEMPDEREANGKPRQGTVKLSAYHSGGSIYIQITDDGKGLDRDKLVDRATDKGLIPSNQTLTDEEAYMLIFAPGFSTAEVVTDVSGRGVGMDVVRRNIESMRGRVNIESELGKGSVFRIELPLTLAIMEGIETRIGNQHYIVPSLSVVEFLRPTPDMIMRTLDTGETLKFRGQFLPIYSVGDLYNIPSQYHDPADGIVLVVDVSGKLFAILVDDVVGKISAVIKSLGNVYKEVEGVSGCAILPDGSIGLILDVGTFIQYAQSDKAPTTRIVELAKMESRENLISSSEDSRHSGVRR